MSHPEEPRIDFASLARKLRAKGSLIQLEATNLQQQGKDEDAERLAAPAQELMVMADQLEAWREASAEDLRRVALTIALQRYALDEFEFKSGPAMRAKHKTLFEEAADITDGTAGELDRIAQQLDPRDLEENDHA